jgi:CRISPR/Cas system-associated exonuclease Cas4 (RecB family)
MITISASKVKTFTTCQRQYYYRYFERLQSPVTGRALLGRCVHKAVELGFQGQEPIGVFSDHWSSGVSEVQDNSNLSKLYNEGLTMVSKYNFDQVPPLEMELGFTLPFPNADHPICYVNGYIDQIFPNHVVVDLKTGLRRPKQSVLNNMPQFILYAWAYLQLYGKIPRVYWEHLRTAERLEAEITPEAVHDMEFLARAVVGKVEGTRNIEDYFKNVSDNTCGQCDYRDICLSEERQWQGM